MYRGNPSCNLSATDQRGFSHGANGIDNNKKKRHMTAKVSKGLAQARHRSMRDAISVARQILIFAGPPWRLSWRQTSPLRLGKATSHRTRGVTSPRRGDAKSKIQHVCEYRRRLLLPLWRQVAPSDRPSPGAQRGTERNELRARRGKESRGGKVGRKSLFILPLSGAPRNRTKFLVRRLAGAAAHGQRNTQTGRGEIQHPRRTEQGLAPTTRRVAD